MKTLTKLHAERGIWMIQSDHPKCSRHEVIIKIRKTAICGTDMHIYQWNDWAQNTIPTPMIIGHEFIGEIVQVGSDVTELKIGDRVSGEGHITCNQCRNCRTGHQHLCRKTIGVGVNRNGAFAEYLVIPANNTIKIPSNISDDIAAILDPLGNAAHAALSFDLIGKDILITGAGSIGIMAAAIAKHVGARHVVITDINDFRLELAKKMGVTRAVNVTKEPLNSVMNELDINEGFDVGLEMSGSSNAFHSMLEGINHGGKIALLGILETNTTIDWNQVIFKGLTIKGIYGREMYETWYKMISMLQTGLDISQVITHHFKIDDFQEAFDTIISGQSGKVILDWN
ncbi:L-threonine 3-dehydrogenase [Marinomonas sp. 5E14-1]|uniref:L-threonine 3-dehydrogenase n=1 Tax=Marinomonas sp. 5E14-1 TaxID=3153922 RepID=UPI0032659B42